MRTSSCRILLASMILGAAELPGQTAADRATRDCPGTRSAAGSIRGVVRDDSTGAGAPRLFVQLVGGSCSTLTDSLGRFTFRNVAVGTHAVAVGSLSYRRVRPLLVTVAADSVVDVVIRLQPQNAVADCLEHPVCASLIATDSMHAPDLGPEERIREMAFRVTIAINGGYRVGGPVLCISDPAQPVVETLRRRFPTAVNDSECETLQDPRERSNVVHGQSRLRGARVSVSNIRQAGDLATARTHWYVGPRHATGWTCSFEKKGGEWQPQWCRLDFIS